MGIYRIGSDASQPQRELLHAYTPATPHICKPSEQERSGHGKHAPLLSYIPCSTTHHVTDFLFTSSTPKKNVVRPVRRGRRTQQPSIKLCSEGSQPPICDLVHRRALSSS
jgi:hypothetical protein